MMVPDKTSTLPTGNLFRLDSPTVVMTAAPRHSITCDELRQLDSREIRSHCVFPSWDRQIDSVPKMLRNCATDVETFCVLSDVWFCFWFAFLFLRMFCKLSVIRVLLLLLFVCLFVCVCVCVCVRVYVCTYFLLVVVFTGVLRTLFLLFAVVYFSHRLFLIHFY